MTVVIPFLGGIDPNPNTKLLRAAIGPDHADLHLVCTYLRLGDCLLYTSPSPRDVEESRMPSSA